MAKINLAELTIKKAGDLIHNGEISCRELVSIYFENIKEHDKNKLQFRLSLIYSVAQVLKNGLSLLGIEAPEEM